MKITREDVTIEILEILSKFQNILYHNHSHIYIEDYTKMLPSVQVRYKRLVSIFASMGIEINNVKYLNDLEFINDYKDYQFSEEIIRLIKDEIKNFYEVTVINNQNLQRILERIIYFRKTYIEVFEGFFGGAKIMGGIPIDERVAKEIVISCLKINDDTVDRLNKVIALLFFPNIEAFDYKMLVDKYNFPTENYIEMDRQEWDDYNNGV